MKYLFLLFATVLSLNLAAPVNAQDFLFNRIEDVSQINLSTFGPSLKEEVINHEAIFVLLPRDGTSVYKKTLTNDNVDEIKDVLVYLIKIKDKDVPVIPSLFDQEISSTLESLNNKYGPSIRYTVTSITKYNLKKVETHDLSNNPVQKETKVIIPDNEESPIESFFTAVLYVSGGFIIIQYLRYRRRQRKDNDDHSLPNNYNQPKSILGNNKYEKDKNDFFTGNGHRTNVLKLIIVSLLLSACQLMAQTVYIDNTITKEFRIEVKNIVLQTARFNTAYYLFGDSVRYLGRLDSSFTSLDSIFKSITFKDQNTSFSSLLNHAKRTKGICYIITDGNPDYFKEDIPDFYFFNKDSLKDTTKASGTKDISNSKNTFNKIISLVKDNLVLSIILACGALLIVYFVITATKKSKVIEKPIRSLIYRDFDGKLMTFTDRVKISAKGNSLFSDIHYDPRTTDIEIILQNDDVFISSAKINN